MKIWWIWRLWCDTSCWESRVECVTDQFVCCLCPSVCTFVCVCVCVCAEVDCCYLFVWRRCVWVWVCNALLSPLCFTCCPGNPKTPPCHAIGSAQPNELPAASNANQSRNGTDHMTVCACVCVCHAHIAPPATNPAGSPAAVPPSACAWTSLFCHIGSFIIGECSRRVCGDDVVMVQCWENLFVLNLFSFCFGMQKTYLQTRATERFLGNFSLHRFFLRSLIYRSDNLQSFVSHTCRDPLVLGRLPTWRTGTIRWWKHFLLQKKHFIGQN